MAGGGGEGKMLSLRASCRAFSIGEGGREEDEDHMDEGAEGEREWAEGKRSRGTVGDGEEEWCSSRGSGRAPGLGRLATLASPRPTLLCATRNDSKREENAFVIVRDGDEPSIQN